MSGIVSASVPSRSKITVSWRGPRPFSVVAAVPDAGAASAAAAGPGWGASDAPVDGADAGMLTGTVCPPHAPGAEPVGHAAGPAPWGAVGAGRQRTLWRTAART